LKRRKVEVDIDTMETEQIVGIYRILEKERTITEVALWSCFFDYKSKDSVDNLCSGVKNARIR
jgi:hypothetical protein